MFYMNLQNYKLNINLMINLLEKNKEKPEVIFNNNCGCTI